MHVLVFAPILFATAGAIIIPITGTIARRASPTFSNATSLSATGKGASSGTKAALAPEPFSCSLTFPTLGGAILWNTVSPFNLLDIEFTGEAVGECTIPMLSITVEVSAVDWEDRPHVVTAGECAECAALTSTPTGYTCVQNPIGGQCDGEWQWSYEAVFEAPPGFEFTSGSGGCVPEGPILTCAQTVDAAFVPLLNVNTAGWSLPPGVQTPILDSRALENIRNSHFDGGSAVDNSKGIFNPTLTDVDLESLFLEGMNNRNPFTLNKNNNYEKTFPRTGVGRSSAQNGGGESTQLTLVINAFEVVVTMYPV